MDEQVLEPEKTESGLAAVIDKILDRGLIINADVGISVSGSELLTIKIKAALASFETAAQFGLEFPSGTNIQTQAWKEAMVGKETCPQCGKRVAEDELLNACCPWCGWESAKAKSKKKKKIMVVEAQ